MIKELEMQNLPAPLRDFAAYKGGIQGCSPKTVSEYLFDLRTFFKYIIATRNGIPVDSEEFEKISLASVDMALVASVRTDEVMMFLMYAGDKRTNAWSAKARKLSAIKGFYKFYVNKKKMIDVNPAIDIESPKPKKTLPKVLSLEESIKLLEAVKNDSNSKNTVRDYCIITLFLNCGMRLSELAGIRLGDIDSELRSVRITGKGSKQRIVYFNQACQTALADYLKLRLTEELLKLDIKHLFLSGRGRNSPISVKTIEWMVTKYLALAGLENRGYSVHKLRHTAATLMYQSGNVDVRTIKDILGHEQLNTTQIYTHVSNKNMEDAMACNPLASIKPKDDE